MYSLTEVINLDWNLYAVIFGAVLYLTGLAGCLAYMFADLEPAGRALRVLVLSLLVCLAGGLCVVNHLP